LHVLEILSRLSVKNYFKLLQVYIFYEFGLFYAGFPAFGYHPANAGTYAVIRDF
jgi:hypothetical protein